MNSLQTSRTINGIKTDLIVQAFADRVLVLVTQFGKVGNLIQASIPATAALTSPSLPGAASASDAINMLPSPPASIHLTPLMGAAPNGHLDILYKLYASQIATIIWLSEANHTMSVHRRSVVVGIALRRDPCSTDDSESITPNESQCFHEIMAMLQDMLNRPSAT